MIRTALALVAFLPSLAGCALYVPSVAYAPLPERAGEVRVRGGFGLQGLSATVSASPVRSVLVFAGAETEFGTGDTITYRERRLVGGGAGAYGRLGRFGIIEALGGFDTGRVVTSHDPFDFWGPERQAVVKRGSMTRAYGQLDVGLRGRWRYHADVAAVSAVSIRVSAVRFTDLSETEDGRPQSVPTEAQMTVFEPGFVGSLSTGPLRFETGLRLSMPLGRPEYIGFDPFRSEFGVSLALDQLFRPAQGRDRGTE